MIFNQPINPECSCLKKRIAEGNRKQGKSTLFYPKKNKVKFWIKVMETIL